MGAVFQMGEGKGIGGSFALYDGNFNGLSLKGTDLDWKLGASGAKLDKVDVGFFNLQNPPWYIEGGFTVLVGETRVAGRWPLEVEARGRFSSDYRVDIRGNAAIAGIPVGNAYLTYIPSFNVDAGAQIDLLSIIIGSAQIQARAGSIGGSIAARVQVPPYVPLIGRWQLGGAHASFLFAPPNWEAAGNVGVNVSPEIPSWCTPWWCPPCIPYCYPRGWSWVNARWCPPCIPPICTPASRQFGSTLVSRSETAAFPSAPSTWTARGALGFGGLRTVSLPRSRCLERELLGEALASGGPRS